MLCLSAFALGCGSTDGTVGDDASGAEVGTDTSADTTVVDSTSMLDGAIETTVADASTDAPIDATADTGVADTGIAADTSATDTGSDACTKCGATGCCTAKQACLLGTCVDCGSSTVCGASCVDTTTDPSHCGACDKACKTGEVCAAGTCGTTCPSGKTLCEGACRDLTIDPNDCGTCGKVCPGAPSASPTCTAGVCGHACVPGRADCNKSMTDGCEARLDAWSSCGDCATKCGTGYVCSSSLCTNGLYVFATKDTFLPGFSGGPGADTKCQAAATAAGLPGTFKAWMSAPATRFAKGVVPYVLPNGTVVASNWGDLVDGTLAHGIDVDEFGNSVTGSVWTDANAAGNAFSLSKNCSGWASASSSLDGSIGKVGATDLTWASQFGWHSQCNNQHHLYCFAQ